MSASIHASPQIINLISSVGRMAKQRDTGGLVATADDLINALKYNNDEIRQSGSAVTVVNIVAEIAKTLAQKGSPETGCIAMCELRSAARAIVNENRVAAPAVCHIMLNTAVKIGAASIKAGQLTGAMHMAEVAEAFCGNSEQSQQKVSILKAEITHLAERQALAGLRTLRNDKRKLPAPKV